MAVITERVRETRWGGEAEEEEEEEGKKKGRGQEIRKREWEKPRWERCDQEWWERGMDSENMCQCVHVCQLNNKHTTIYLGRTRKTVRLALKLRLPDRFCVCASCCCSPSLAHGHTTTWFFKGLTVGLFTQRKIGSLNLPQFKHEFT